MTFFHYKHEFHKRWYAYLAGVAVYSMGLLVYTQAPYYQQFINRENIQLDAWSGWWRIGMEIFFGIIGRSTLEILFHLYLGYLFFGLLFFLFSDRANVEHTRPVVLIRGLVSTLNQIKKYFQELGKASKVPHIEVTHEEKVTFLFFLVKLFYLPLMLNFAFGNLSSVVDFYHRVFDAQGVALQMMTRLVYLFLFNIMFLVDTLYFVVGYAFEFKSWKNEVRSVEPTLFGWLIALACYPPFNSITGLYLPWGSSDYADFGSYGVTVFFASIALLCTFVYLWATLSLGTKCSNLTNRGIVKRGAYAFVRHPAYIAKNMMWFIMGIPIIEFHIGSFSLNGFQVPMLFANWGILLSILGWAMIYFLRAVTEERHLMQDPDYQAYAQKLKYRFIPGVF